MVQPFDSPYHSSTESFNLEEGFPFGSSTESLHLEAGFPNGISTESLHLEAGFPNGRFPNGISTESLHLEAGSISLPKMAAEDNIDEENIEKAKKVKDTKRGEDTKFSVPFYKLFIMADTTDIILMSIAAIASVVNGLSLPIMSILFGNITDAFGQNEGANIHRVVHEVSQVALQFIDLASVAAIASFFQVAFWSCTGQRQAARIRSVYLKTILRQDITFFDCETSTGEVIERMSGDTILIQEAIGGKVGMFIQFTSAFFGGFIVAFTKGWKLTLVMLATIPFLVAAGSAMSMIIAKTSSRSQKAYAEAGNVVEQTIGSIRTVASFTGEKKAVTDYDKSLKIAYKAAAQKGLAAGFGMGTSLFIIYCTYALALSYGSQLIINEGYSGGNVLNVIFAVLSGSMSITQTSPCLNAFAAGQAAAYTMFETINRKPEIDIYDTKGLVFKDIHGDIELRDVYFRYPARPDVEIFSGFSLRIPRGTTAALVGESGSGKSTVISLVERFYDPQAGEVLIDSFNIKQFQLKWIRQKIGLVSQEPVLFACTIKENIAYGKDGATLEEIHIAAELANAAKFISKMPQGFDTMVGEHGTQLSGGQKQRIAIARAILKDPRILLLDEATSALDIESEKVVQEALNRIMINRTTVIVAHRLTTVRNADMIAVVKRGTIVEKGPHSRLTMNPSGAYSQLIHLQEVHQSEDQHSNDPDQHEIHLHNSKYISRVEFRRSTLKSIINESSGIGGSHRSILFPSAFPGEETLQDVEDGQQNLAKDVPLLRLASLNKPEAPVLILGSIAAIVNGCSLPAFALLFSSIMGSFYEGPHNLRKDVRFWSLIIVALAATSFLVTPLQMYCFAVAGGRLVRRIRSLTFQKVVYQEIGWFDHSENSTGAIGARLSADAATVRSVVGDALSLVIQNISTIIAGIVIAFIANWKLALLVLAMLPLLGLQGFVQIKFTAGFFADAKVMYEQASQVAKDALGSIRTVASFSAEEKVMTLYSEKCTTPLTSGIRQGIISGLSFGLSNLMLFSVYGITFWVGAQMAKAGETTFSKVFRVFFSFTMVALGISQSMGRAPDFGKVKASVSTVFQILDRNSKIDANDASGTTLENVKGDIEFRHVSFKYPTRPGVQIFQDLSFCVQTGKTVALVGESGSGKSTVISLLERFYDINSGRILLDGVDIRRLQLKWLRQQMGLVSQEPILFNETIRANIAYGRDGITSGNQIVEASKASNAHQFISRLPQGYETYVGENGLKLSGGQKQRIAIARAIVKNPRILLLDEATSALDAESEHIVQEALDHVMVNRSTIVVAHRLSTIKDADLIAVVKNGVIAEQGKHNELLAIRDGAYASLMRLHRASN